MCHWLSAEQAVPYAHLTTPVLAQSLKKLVVPQKDAREPTGGIHAVGTDFAGMPAALAVVQRSAGSTLAVLGLAVAEPFRRLSLAKQLLQWIPAEALRLGCSNLTVSFPLDHGCTTAMKRLTDPALGWQHSPGLRLVHLD